MRPRARGAVAGLPFAVLLLLATAGCGGEAPAPVEAVGQPDAPRHATVRVGDVTIRANALRTSTLDAQVAERYGIARDPDTVLLLVGVREGAAEAPRAARVAATVTDLRGQRSPVPMRELHGTDPSGAPLRDHFGIVAVSPPDTLRFDVRVDWPGGPGATLRVEQEVGPR